MRIISKKVEGMSYCSPLFAGNNKIYSPQTHADNSQTIYYFCLGDLPSQKHYAFQAKVLIVSRLSGIDVFASAGRGDKISASVCVRRANEVSGRLIRHNGKNSTLISLSNRQYITYLNHDTYFIIGSTYTN
jgi:hypothetical protein